MSFIDECAKGGYLSLDTIRGLNRLTRCPKVDRAEAFSKGIAIGCVLAYARSLKV